LASLAGCKSLPKASRGRKLEGPRASPPIRTESLLGSGASSQHFPRKDLSGNRATASARVNHAFDVRRLTAHALRARSASSLSMASGHCHAICFRGRLALRRKDVKAPKADVAPSARAQVFRGTVAGLPAFPRRHVSSPRRPGLQPCPPPWRPDQSQVSRKDERNPLTTGIG
jgi:hypothetical protein